MSLPNLVEARITHNYMPVVPSFAFEKMQKLEKLDLSNNQIMNIGLQTWSNLANLRE